MHRRIFVVLILLVAGCAWEERWYQKGKTEGDMEIARYECHVEWKDKHGTVAADNRSSEYVTALRRCMADKGYTLVESKK